MTMPPHNKQKEEQRPVDDEAAERSHGSSANDLQRSLLPLPTSKENKQISEIISTERNYDKWANFIFPHTKTTDLAEIRKHVWDVTLPNGVEATASILITPAKNGKCYTTRSYDVYLALIAFWRDMGMPDTPMNLTLSQIAKKLGMGTGGKDLQIILDELHTLYFTNVSWVLSFQHLSEKNTTTKNQRVLETFNYSTREERGGVLGHGGVTVQFHRTIMENIRNNITTPVNFAARKAIRSSVAKTLYGRMDSILATTPRIERRLDNIVKEFNLTPSRYKHKSQRKILGDLLVRNLHLAELSNLNIMQVEMVETADQSDYKLIFTTSDPSLKKIPKPATKKSAPHLPVVNTDKNVVENLVYHMKELLHVTDPKDDGLYYTLARHYDEVIIWRAIGEFKEMLQSNPKIGKRAAYFTSLVHLTAHRLGREWIKPCGRSCKFRPENLLPL